MEQSAADHSSRMRFLLDSGAFTAWRIGERVSLDSYCKFLETTKIPIWRYFVLDVIGDARATQRNLETMVRRGFSPIPIFTRGEDPKHLTELFAVSDLVGIGGLVGTRGSGGFIKGITPHLKNRKAHWLGFTSLSWIKHYRPFSVDSSSWSAGVRYGSIDLYLGNGRFRRITKQDFSERPDIQICKRLREMGLEPKRFGQADQWRNLDGLALRQATYRSAVLAARDIEKNLGTKFFIVTASGKQIRTFAQTIDQLDGGK